MIRLIVRIWLLPLLLRTTFACLALQACRLLPRGDFQIWLTWHALGRANALVAELEEAVRCS